LTVGLLFLQTYRPYRDLIEINGKHAAGMLSSGYDRAVFSSQPETFHLKGLIAADQGIFEKGADPVSPVPTF
jgi:hypothetical protein